MSQQRVVTNEDLLETIQHFVQMVSERFDRLETRMDRLELRMDKLEVRMGNIEQRLDIIEHDISDLRQTSYRQEQGLGRAIAIFEMHTQKSTPTTPA